MKKNILIVISLLIFFSCNEKKQNKENIEIRVYNRYFDFTSNKSLNRLRKMIGSNEVQDFKIKNLKIKSDLTHKDENPYNLNPISSLEAFEKLNSSSSKIIGLDLRVNDYEELNSILKKLATQNFIKSIKLNADELNSIPSSIYKLNSLTNLEISCSKINSISTNISKLKNLEKLHFYDCLNLKELPLSLGKLSKIKILEIDKISNIMNHNLNFISNLKSLEYLRLRNFPFTIPKDFKKLDKLKLVEITNLNGKHKINLNNTIDIKNIYLNKNIKSLMISGINLNNFHGISNLHSLTELYLGSDISLSILKKLPQLKSLKLLQISNNSPELTSELGKLQNIEMLRIAWCKKIIELPKEINLMKNLKYLILQNNTELIENNLKLSKMNEELIIFNLKNKKMKPIKNCTQQCIKLH